jgi:hypothetical protein
MPVVFDEVVGEVVPELPVSHHDDVSEQGGSDELTVAAARSALRRIALRQARLEAD